MSGGKRFKENKEKEKWVNKNSDILLGTRKEYTRMIWLADLLNRRKFLGQKEKKVRIAN